jgi:hypothetical protein
VPGVSLGSHRGTKRHEQFNDSLDTIKKIVSVSRQPSSSTRPT